MLHLDNSAVETKAVYVQVKQPEYFVNTELQIDLPWRLPSTYLKWFVLEQRLIIETVLKLKIASLSYC